MPNTASPRWVGRILHDIGALRAGRLSAAEAAAKAEGVASEEALLLDALLEEGAQNVTIDSPTSTSASGTVVSRCSTTPGTWSSSQQGHRAASADAALLVVSAPDRAGEQTRQTVGTPYEPPGRAIELATSQVSLTAAVDPLAKLECELRKI